MPFIVVIYLVIMVLLVPFLNLYNLRLMEEAELRMPSKKKLYLQSAFNQLVLAGLALWAALASDIRLSYTGNFNTTALIAAGVFVAAGFILSHISARSDVMRDDNPGLDMLKPETPGEKFVWVMVNLVASACEEIMFRGVLFYIFYKTSNNIYVAALMSALCFGFSHSIQGRIAIVVTVLFALGLQYLAYLNNGLLLPMAVHFVHNMLTTFLLLKNDRGGRPDNSLDDAVVESDEQIPL